MIPRPESLDQRFADISKCGTFWIGTFLVHQIHRSWITSLGNEGRDQELVVIPSAPVHRFLHSEEKRNRIERFTDGMGVGKSHRSSEELLVG